MMSSPSPLFIFTLFLPICTPAKFRNRIQIRFRAYQAETQPILTSNLVDPVVRDGPKVLRWVFVFADHMQPSILWVREYLAALVGRQETFKNLFAILLPFSSDRIVCFCIMEVKEACFGKDF